MQRRCRVTVVSNVWNATSSQLIYDPAPDIAGKAKGEQDELSGDPAQRTGELDRRQGFFEFTDALKENHVIIESGRGFEDRLG